MKKILTICFSALILCQSASAWGDLGHWTIGEVAQRHLTPKAARTLDKYLNGKKLACIASDADKYRSYWVMDLGFIPTNPDYARVAFLKDFDRSQPLNISPWSHSITVNGDCIPYETDNLDGAYINNDCYYVTKLEKQLREGAETMDPAEREKAIALIVHFIGDMHCPVHIVYLPDNPSKGKFNVSFKGKKMNYHSFWDGQMFGGIQGGFGELAYMVDTKSKKEIREISKGNVYDWAKDSAEKSRVVYDLVKPDSVIPDTFPYDHRDLLYSQLRNAGYRLAAELNAIFK